MRDIIERGRARLVGRLAASGEAGDPTPVADGGSAKTVRRRRAHAWAGVYAATFGIDGDESAERDE